jgi:hypothetical protein
MAPPWVGKHCAETGDPHVGLNAAFCPGCGGQNPNLLRSESVAAVAYRASVEQGQVQSLLPTPTECTEIPTIDLTSELSPQHQTSDQQALTPAPDWNDAAIACFASGGVANIQRTHGIKRNHIKNFQGRSNAGLPPLSTRNNVTAGAIPPSPKKQPPKRTINYTCSAYLAVGQQDSTGEKRYTICRKLAGGRPWHDVLTEDWESEFKAIKDTADRKDFVFGSLLGPCPEPEVQACIGEPSFISEWNDDVGPSFQGNSWLDARSLDAFIACFRSSKKTQFKLCFEQLAQIDKFPPAPDDELNTPKKAKARRGSSITRSSPTPGPSRYRKTPVTVHKAVIKQEKGKVIKQEKGKAIKQEKVTTKASLTTTPTTTLTTFINLLSSSPLPPLSQLSTLTAIVEEDTEELNEEEQQLQEEEDILLYESEVRRIEELNKREEEVTQQETSDESLKRARNDEQQEEAMPIQKKRRVLVVPPSERVLRKR